MNDLQSQLNELAALQARKAEIDALGDSATDTQRIERHYAQIKIKRMACRIDFVKLADRFRELEFAEVAAKKLCAAITKAGAICNE